MADIQIWDEVSNEMVTVSQNHPIPVSSTPATNSVGTTELKDGAVTDAKLANPKVNVNGTTPITGNQQFQSGLNFGGAQVTGTHDLSKHIDLSAGNYGFNVTSYTMNLHTGSDPAQSKFVFWYGENELAVLQENITDTHALTTKAYVDAAVAGATVADGSITDAKIANATITAAKFATTALQGQPAANISSGTLDAARIPALDAGKVTTGTFATARIPALPQSQITSLTTDLAAKLTATKGVAVADAAGANPTKAEYDALLASLRTAGIIAT